MQIVTLSPISNREDYIESWQALDDDGEPIDLTGATIVYEVRDPQSTTASLSATTANGKVVIVTTTFTVTLPVASMRDLCAKDYDVGCTIEIDDITTQFFVGKLPVIDGVVA